MKKDIVCGLDIGTFKICAACARLNSSGKIDILASQMSPAEGISKGLVTDNKKLSGAINKAMALLSRMLGKRSRRVYLNINSPDLKVRVCQQRSAPLPLHRKDIFAADGSSGTTFVSALLPTIHNFLKSVKLAGLIVEDIVPSGYAQALGLVKDFPRSSGENMIIDLGAALTKIYLFEDGVLKRIAVLPVGAQGITDEIAARLKVSFDCAEALKTKYGRLFYEQRPLDQRIIIQDKSIKRVISSQGLNQIISARADQLLQRVKKELSALNCDQQKFKAIIVTGGGSILEGFLERAEKVLERPLRMGFLHAVNNQRIQAQSPLYATSIGLVHFGLQQRNNKGFPVRKKPGPFRHWLNRAGKLYREYF